MAVPDKTFFEEQYGDKGTQSLLSFDGTKPMPMTLQSVNTDGVTDSFANLSFSGGRLRLAAGNVVNNSVGATAAGKIALWYDTTGINITYGAFTGPLEGATGVVQTPGWGSAAQMYTVAPGGGASQWRTLSHSNTGTAFSVSTTSGTLIVNTPTVSATNAGVLSTGADTIAGLKTFNSDIVLAATSGGTTSGQIWNDTTQKAHAVYESGIKQMLVGIIFTQTADKTVTNTVTETSILGTGVGTKTLPANFFLAGKTIRLRVGGIYSTPALGATATIKIKYGTTVLATVATSSLLGGASGLRFDGEVLITCRTTGATGTVMTHGDIEYATGVTGTLAVDPLNNAGATTTIDTTTSSALDVTITWDSNTTTRIATSIIATIEVLN